MAVKTSWSAGDTLAAQDLTDTFAAKAPTASPTFTGTVDFTGATVTGLTAAGMTLVASQSFSAASSVSVNSCFTTAYSDYLINIALECSGGTALNMRLRASGTDNSSGNYQHAGVRYLTDNSTAGAGAAGQNQWVISSATGASPISTGVSLTVLRPQLAARTLFSGTGTAYAGGAAKYTAEFIGGQFSDAAQFDGFSIYGPAQTITGTVRVDGYKNS